MQKNDISSEPALRIDVDEVIRSRAPRHYRYIPKQLIHWLERTICQREMNDFLARHGHKRDGDFCRALLSDLDVTVTYQGLERLPDPANRRVLYVSNHPLGGLDGMALIDFVERRHGVKPRFVVNDLLSAVKPLSGCFLPVNKHGAQSRDAVRAVDEAFAEDVPVIMFPAGLVSRRQRGGVVRDLRWQKMFINKARQFHRDIIPLHFCGENSSFFYKFAMFRKKIGLKFNIEMIYLPREVFRSRGKNFVVAVGDPISWQSLAGGEKALAEAQRIRDMVYAIDPCF